MLTTEKDIYLHNKAYWKIENGNYLLSKSQGKHKIQFALVWLECINKSLALTASQYVTVIYSLV